MEAKVDRLVPKTMGFDSPKAQKSGRMNPRCNNALRTTRSTLVQKVNRLLSSRRRVKTSPKAQEISSEIAG
jgi:hypothetical protein